MSKNPLLLIHEPLQNIWNDRQGMKLKEAKEILEKLKPLENKAEMKRGGKINKFFIVPMEYLTEKDYSIYWPDFWQKDIAISTDKRHGVEYTLVAIKRTKSMTVFVCKDLDYIQALAQYQ